MLVTEKYAGFLGQVHGGYLAGLLARHVGPSAKVMLRRPVATGSELTLVRADNRVVVEQSGVVVAEAASHPFAMDTPPGIDFARAQRASHAYLGFDHHLFPHCFCCGPDRGDGDGLRIFPAPIAGRDAVAAPWVPHRAFADADGNVQAEVLWASLDCPALWSLIHHSPEDSAAHVVSGTIAMHIAGPVKAGERHVILAWPIGVDGRKILAGAALYSEGGEVLAAARQVCIRLDTGVPLGRAKWLTAGRSRNVGERLGSLE